MLNQIESNPNVSNQTAVKYLPARTGPAYCGPGDRVTFLITGAETGGAFFMAEVSVVPGGGPPPHVHTREDETFYIQQGTLAAQVGDKSLRMSAGDFVHLPRGVVHSFKNIGDETAKMLMVVTPAGLENYFAESFIPAADAADIPDIVPAVIARATKNAPKYGLELQLPNGARH
jgi:quercetin dioxygenase-like cupin family protein